MRSLRYDELVQKSLISVVKEVLEDVSVNGLPGNHHFYVRFRTDHPKTRVPFFLKEQHPEEVMIVIQYQFWNLKVFRDEFCIDLSFNGIQETLMVPFSALVAFVDPSVKFALHFTPSFTDDPDPKLPEREKEESTIDRPTDGENIISFDSFRKK
jgi:hypothetical protein